jgi:hypothetical protein
LCLKKSKVFRINKPDAHSRRLLLIIQVTFNGSRQTDLKEENMNIHSLQKSTISGKYRSDLVIKSATHVISRKLTFETCMMSNNRLLWASGLLILKTLLFFKHNPIFYHKICVYFSKVKIIDFNAVITTKFSNKITWRWTESMV